MTARAVSVLEVEREGLWPLLDAVAPETMFAETLSPTRRVVTLDFDKSLDALRASGIRVLVRYARRSATEVAEARDHLAHVIEGLPREAREVLFRAQAHSRDGVVIGSHVWDPLEQAEAVRILHGAELIRAVPGTDEPMHGRYRLHEDLPPPPEPEYDFDEAVMELTDDLSQARPSPVDMLHDLAALAAALSHHRPRRTHKGTLDTSSVKKLGRRLAAAELSSGALDERWSRALRALEALGAVRMEPISRELFLEPGLGSTLEGNTADALDRLVHRLVDPDLQAALPAVRAALRAAEDGALDEMIFLEEVEAQHRDVIFAPWRRDGQLVYPEPAGDRLPWTEEAFNAVEGRMIHELLRLMDRLGLIRRAPGVFAATAAGKVWATGADPQAPPIWLGSDLEALVPPASITPWERYQLERFGRCLSRDVVDRYSLERESLEAWLATHELSEAMGLLQRRSAAVPLSVRETLTEWARNATQFVLTRGVLLTQ
ncbi:MAG: hypothetical protein KC912_10325 [Proteobacteria bacterium]|nr:hypothetical protein [Pseudomonadota bacterium]